jgi:hypothetical protein
MEIKRRGGIVFWEGREKEGESGTLRGDCAVYGVSVYEHGFSCGFPMGFQDVDCFDGVLNFALVID